jgi:RimJ/RimL family protein N-acetyltransferase
MLTDLLPEFGLVLRTPRLELRLPSTDQLVELGQLAAEGVHDPAEMPFLVPWTDQSPLERARSTIRYRWRIWGAWTPADWTLAFVVLLDDVVVGTQDLSGREFATLREVGTGSWLGLKYHRQGIGTEMRAAVLHLAFAGLDAQSAVSDAFTDNRASLGVSRKLGYTRDGVRRFVRRGQPATSQLLRLDRAGWESHRTVPVEVEGLQPCLPLLGLGPTGDGPAAVPGA